MTTLDQLQLGQGGRLTAIDDDGALSQRLMAMGLLPGAAVKIVQVAPLGDPIMIESSVGRISLRRAEARSLHIDEQSGAEAGSDTT